ncbi:MAG: FkbM family methyltransferase [Rhodobacteraceae bacterium]|nr:FkbM family methyltransferase [Paracoccaceae bacterium]
MTQPDTSRPATAGPMVRRPLSGESYARLRALGVPVGTVVDVGVLSCTPSLMAGWPDVPHLLIEPIADWEPKIRANYTQRKIAHDLALVAAADRDGSMAMETSTVLTGVPVSHARLAEKPRAGAPTRSVPVRRLDTLLPERGARPPYLLKIDVDGAELDILRGARGILPDCSIVVVEAGLLSLVERASAVAAAGFQFFDFVDPCYYDGRLWSFDLVFLNEKTIAERGIDMYKQAFDMGKWYDYG